MLFRSAQKHGARGALFGRKINNAEHQLAFIEMLRLITDGRIFPEEAVRAYHGVLQARKIKPKLPLDKDLQLTDQAMSYGGSGAARSSATIQNNPLRAGTAEQPAGGGLPTEAAKWPALANGQPDFERMSSEQRRAYDRQRLTRKFG